MLLAQKGFPRKVLSQSLSNQIRPAVNKNLFRISSQAAFAAIRISSSK
jgi:hypothetical protein